MPQSTNFPRFLNELDPSIYTRGTYAVLDLETTNLEKGAASVLENRIVAFTVFRSDTGRVYRQYYEGSGGEYSDLLDSLREIDFIVAQNAKFELQWLYRLGLEKGSILVWDTMLAQYCINGNRKTELNLDAIAELYGFPQKDSVVKAMLRGGACPSTIPKKRLIEYNTGDVLNTHSVFLAQRAEVERCGLLPVTFTRCLTCLALSDIENVGMCLDPKRVKTEHRIVLNEYNEVLAEIHTATGGINPRSPKQMAEFLYDKMGFDEATNYRGEPIRTPTGTRSTSLETILALEARTNEQRGLKALFERFSPLKVKKTTLEKMLKCCEENNGILHANFNQTNTRNHRLSSTGKRYKIQLQNIDRDFKRLFTARHENWKIADPDAPRLEFVVAGELTGDPQVMTDTVTDYDVHRFTASVITKTPFETVTDKQRADNKPHTFKPVYLGQSGTPDEVRYYTAFNKKYHVMYKAQKGWCFEVLKNKKLRIATGLVFYWPDVKVYDSGFIKYTNEIANYPVSNLATAEIMQIAMVYLWYRMRGMKGFIVNTVHDSIPAEIPIEEEDEFWEKVKQAFVYDVYIYLKKVYGIQWHIPLGVEMKVGDHWGEGKKRTHKGKDPGNFLTDNNV
jgi:DNA polymerase I-like protein with 3'-5' exonuclease and polymerase domains